MPKARSTKRHRHVFNDPGHNTDYIVVAGRKLTKREILEEVAFYLGSEERILKRPRNSTVTISAKRTK